MLRIFCLIILGVTITPLGSIALRFEKANFIRLADNRGVENSEYIARHELPSSMSKYKISSEMSDISSRRRRSPQDLPAPIPSPDMPAPIPVPPGVPGRKRRSPQVMPDGRIHRLPEVNGQGIIKQFSSQDRNHWELIDSGARRRRTPQEIPWPIPMPPIPEMPSRRRRSPEDFAGEMENKQQQAQEKAAEVSEQKDKLKEKAKEGGVHGKAMAESAKEKVPSGPGK